MTGSTKTYDMAAKSFSEHVNNRVQELKQNSYKTIPAKVISTKDYEELQCLSVEFSIRDIFNRKDASILESVRLEKVFVRLPKFGGWKFKYPVSEGDLVILYWSHRDLSTFLDGDGSSIAQPITEIGELNDCFIELGFGTRKNHNNPSLKNLILAQDATTLTITPKGDVTMVTEGNISTTASGTHFLKSSHLTIDNSVTINENLTVLGNSDTEGNTTTQGTTESAGIVTATSGVYASTYAGLGGGAASFAVDMGINGTVTINGVEVNTHTHLDAEGRPTGIMQ